MRISLRCLLGIALPFWMMFIAVQTEAGTKPTLKVEVKVAEPSYRATLGDAEAADLERKATQLIIDLLNRNAGFLNYSTDSGTLVLRFTLDAKEQPVAAHRREVGFHIKLSGTNFTARVMYTKFRDADAFSASLGRVDDLVFEISIRLGQPDFVPSLVEQILSGVPIAESGELLRNGTLHWIIPFRHDELCLDSNSVLFIQHEVQGNLGPSRKRAYAQPVGPFQPNDPSLFPQYRDNLLSDQAPEQRDVSPEVQLLMTAPLDRIRVKQVFVRFYVGNGVCATALPPIPGGGSGGPQ